MAPAFAAALLLLLLFSGMAPLLLVEDWEPPASFMVTAAALTDRLTWRPTKCYTHAFSSLHHSDKASEY